MFFFHEIIIRCPISRAAKCSSSVLPNHGILYCLIPLFFSEHIKVILFSQHLLTNIFEWGKNKSMLTSLLPPLKGPLLFLCIYRSVWSFDDYSLWPLRSETGQHKYIQWLPQQPGSSNTWTSANKYLKRIHNQQKFCSIMGSQNNKIQPISAKMPHCSGPYQLNACPCSCYTLVWLHCHGVHCFLNAVM